MNKIGRKIIVTLSIEYIFGQGFKKSSGMIGAIAGDIVGSIREWHNIKSTEFELFEERCRFTDDTVLTIAVADCILNKKDYETTIMEYGNRYPNAGYGGSFRKWLAGEIVGPYNSWGNGSAMRVSPVGFAFHHLGDVIMEAEKSAAVTHNHPEGIKGAQAIACAIFLARTGRTKQEIKNFITNEFSYDLKRTLDDIRPHYQFDVSCQGSVPEAIIAFLESENFEDAIRKAISIGGDSDTIACMAGGIAQAYYLKVPSTIVTETRKRLPDDLLEILNAFEQEYIPII
jgi:ADP-ribosylglycohydrolase